MKRAPRESPQRRGVVLPETPRQRRERAALEEDLRALDLRGKPLRIRPRLFRSGADAYLVATRGPLPYMLRLREIERLREEHERRAEDAWRALAADARGDRETFARTWRAWVAGVSFDELNALVDRHNRWYPVESRLPMDPRRGDYALVNGKDFRIEPYGGAWLLERFPADLEAARPL